MTVINVHEAKTNFSKLLDRVSNGERITIGKAGKPVARLEPISLTAKGSRVVGGGFRLQEKAGKPLTPEYLNKLAESKYE
ncbi:MAG: type II toxin-antitoxin system prevent-host-death family antitoxin [Candidatus Saccharibacteria bacterium]